MKGQSSYFFLDLKNNTIAIIKMRTIPPPRRQYKTPRYPGIFSALETGVVGREDEVGEISATCVDDCVAVSPGIVPLPGSPVAVETLLGLDIMV
jgi:hypothetical protein